MSDITSRMPKFVKANSEKELEEALTKISLAIGQKLEIVNIYLRNSSVVAWYFIEASKAPGIPSELPVKKTKKNRKKG